MRWSWRLFSLAVALLAVAIPSPAVAQDGAGCTDTAHVSWESNWDDVTIEAAIVDVPGCADGDEVGLQLLTDDGDLPQDPLVGVVGSEQVRFDLDALDVRIEPVIGVRILLYGETVVEIVHVTVEQRFFSASGNEQQGLRRVTELEVPLGDAYRVPGAPTRYDTATCADMQRWEEPGDLIGQGAGTFTATTAGTHVVCYQQRPGTPGGPPDVEDPSVDQTGVLGDGVTRPGSTPMSGDGPLASTGAGVLGAGILGGGLVLVGRVLTRRRPRSPGNRRQ